MDIEKLIHCLQCCARVDAHNIGCDDCGLEYCGPECQQLCGTAATALSTLQSENEKLRAEAEGMRSNWYKSVEEIQKLRAENIRWGQVASEQDKQLDRLLAELGQVKHQRDSYRMYHDDLASKPNCNTCADKDCKYRPIPGDTVRANCPLWRGPEEEG